VCTGEAYQRYHSYTCGFDLDTIRKQALKETTLNGKLRGIYTLMALKVIGLTLRRPEFPISTFDIPFWAYVLSLPYVNMD